MYDQYTFCLILQQYSVNDYVYGTGHRHKLCLFLNVFLAVYYLVDYVYQGS